MFLKQEVLYINMGYTLSLISKSIEAKLATRGHNQTLHECNYNLLIVTSLVSVHSFQ